VHPDKILATPMFYGVSQSGIRYVFCLRDIELLQC